MKTAVTKFVNSTAQYHLLITIANSLDPDQAQQNVSLVFVWFDSLRPSQQFLSHVSTGLPGFNQY